MTTRKPRPAQPGEAPSTTECVHCRKRARVKDGLLEMYVVRGLRHGAPVELHFCGVCFPKVKPRLVELGLADDAPDGLA